MLYVICYVLNNVRMRAPIRFFHLHWNIVIVGQIIFHNGQTDRQWRVFKHGRKDTVNARSNRRV